jgi:hypothetical protein
LKGVLIQDSKVLKICSVPWPYVYENIPLAPNTTCDIKKGILNSSELRKLAHEENTKTYKYHDFNAPNDNKLSELTNYVFDDNKQRSENFNKPQLENQPEPNHHAYNGNYIIKSHACNWRILKG